MTNGINVLSSASLAFA